NVLEAAAAAGTEHVLVTSSTTAYGAFADNPVPIDEEWPVRGVPDFEYARDKAESDRLCQLWALKHPDRTMTIARPCIVFGSNVDNFIVRLWTKQPFQLDVGTLDQITQFVHEDDAGGVVAAPGPAVPVGVWGAFSGRYPVLCSAAPRAVSSVGRAPARQAGGRWFEPSTAHPRSSLQLHSPRQRRRRARRVGGAD